MNSAAQPGRELLPDKFDELVIEIQRETQAPYSLIACILLAAIALSVQHHCRVERKPGLDGPVGLFIITICESGERKTAVQKILFKIFAEMQRNWSTEASQKNCAYKVDHALWRKKISILQDAWKKEYYKDEVTAKKIEEQLRSVIEAEPCRSVARKLVYTDTTIEALLQGLNECGNSAALVHDEFSKFRQGPMAKQLGAMNALWSGLDWAVDRKTTESFILRDTSLTCLLQAQPALFDEYARSKEGQQALDNGFFARVLICEPLSTQGTRLERNTTHDLRTIDWFYNRCQQLLQRKEPRLLRFSPTAQEKWMRIADLYETSLQPGCIYSNSREFAAKAAEHIARIAGIFHAFLQDDSDEISADTLQYAIHLVDNFAQNYRKRFGRLSPAEVQQRDMHELANWLILNNPQGRNCGIKKSRVLQCGPNRFRSKEKLDILLQLLAAAGAISIYKIENTTTIFFNPAYQIQPFFVPNPRPVPLLV